jgi:hypothetical protein
MHAHSSPPSPAVPTPSPSRPPAPPSALRWVFWGFVAIAAFFLWTEHRAHLIGGLSWLPFLFILACPLMHVFMHRGHGGSGHGHGGHDAEASRGTDASTVRRED